MEQSFTKITKCWNCTVSVIEKDPLFKVRRIPIDKPNKTLPIVKIEVYCTNCNYVHYQNIA